MPGRAWNRLVRLRDQPLLSWRAAVPTEKMTGATQTDGEFIRQIEYQRRVFQSPCQPVEAATTRKGKREAVMEEH